MSEQRGSAERKFLAYRPLVPAAIAFSVGILGREYADLPRAAVWAVALAATAAFPAARWAGFRRLALAALYTFIAAAGWVRLDVAIGRRPSHHLARFLGEQPKLVKLRGAVASNPEHRTSPGMPLSGDSPWLAEGTEQARFDLDADEVEVDGTWRATCGRVHIVDYGPFEGLRYGDRVVVIGAASLPSPPSNPGGIDTLRLFRHRGINAMMSVGRGGITVEKESGARGLVTHAYAARERVRELLRRTLAQDELAMSLACALMLGDRTELDEDLEEAFKRTGTMHLLAISGLHVGILALFVWHLAALLGAGRKLSGMVVLLAVGAYSILTGLPPSVVRAAVMTGAVVLGIMGRRQLDTLQSVALAAVVLLVVRPFDLFHVGFQLSFLAVISIACLREDIASLLRARPSLLEQLTVDEAPTFWQRARRLARHRGLQAISVSTAAWLGVFPLLAFYFNTFSPITVLANLFAVPLVGLLVLLGFPQVGLVAVSPGLAVLAAPLLRWIAWALTEVVKAADRVPLAWAYCAAPELGWVIGYYALGLVVVGRRRLGLSGKHAAMIWMAGMLVYLFAARGERPPNSLEMTVLDVRHGSAVVLRYPDGSTVLCDCGSYGRSDVGRWVAAPALWHWGVRRIDLLVVSHADADHINGIPALLDRFKVGRVLYSPVVERAEAGRQLLEMLDRRGIPHGPARAGDRIEVGRGNILEVLAPTDWTLRACPEDQNENSLVLRASHDGRRILLAADIQRVGTTVLSHAGLDLRADVLVVPHHGCVIPTTEDFARAVRPAYAICSNREEHLAPATLEQYEKAGAKVLATCWDGAVTVKIGQGKIEVGGWKRRKVENP